ncbi:MAG: DUF4347 domain-containing protein [Pseudomonadota bacterium]
MIDGRVDWEAGLRGAFWGPFIALHTRGEARMTSAESMVENVLDLLRPDERIGALRIVDHGSTRHVELGDDVVTPVSFRRHAPALAALAPHFGPSGYAHFVGCHAGLNTALLRAFARLWQVPVFAGRGSTNGLEMNFGGWVRVCPAGRHRERLRWPRCAEGGAARR